MWGRGNEGIALLKNHSRTYGDDDVGRAQAEVKLGHQNLVGFADSPRKGEHQGRLVHQLVLIQVIWKSPFQCLDCRRSKRKILKLNP